MIKYLGTVSHLRNVAYVLVAGRSQAALSGRFGVE